MTIEIPTWLLWTLGLAVGVPLLLGLLALAFFGYCCATAFGGWRR